MHAAAAVAIRPRKSVQESTMLLIIYIPATGESETEKPEGDTGSHADKGSGEVEMQEQLRNSGRGGWRTRRG